MAEIELIFINDKKKVTFFWLSNCRRILWKCRKVKAVTVICPVSVLACHQLFPMSFCSCASVDTCAFPCFWPLGWVSILTLFGSRSTHFLDPTLQVVALSHPLPVCPVPPWVSAVVPGGVVPTYFLPFLLSQMSIIQSGT